MMLKRKFSLFQFLPCRRHGPAHTVNQGFLWSTGLCKWHSWFTRKQERTARTHRAIY